MSSSSSSSRVVVGGGVIPSNVRKTIQNIKEITKNHSEDDIYAMLKDCSMDPNETTQRLLHLDTFHEVKRKRDKRKETGKSGSGEEPRWRPDHQGRGTRGPRGNSFSHYNSNDTGGRRNAFFRKENGVEESREKGFRRAPGPAPKETVSAQPRHVVKSSSIPVGMPVKVPNGTLSGGHDVKPSGAGDAYHSNADNLSNIRHKATTEHVPSVSDPAMVISHDSRFPAAVGAVKREMRNQQAHAEAQAPIPADRGLGVTESMNNNHLNQHEPQYLDAPEVSSSMIVKESLKHEKVALPKISEECPAAKKSDPQIISVVKPSSPQVIGPLGGVEEAASKLEKLKFSDGQHVIIPNHIQVPDAVKNRLSFGSLDAGFGVRENHVKNESIKNMKPVANTVTDEAASNSSSCYQEAVSSAPQAIDEAHSQSQSHLPDNTSTVDSKLSSSTTVPKEDQPKEESLPAVGPPFPVVQTSPGYNFGFMPPMLANTLVQVEGFESQAHMSNSVSGGSPAVTTPSSTPPPTQAGAGQSSVAMSQQPILFRQPYPPNFFPYSHYFPFYVPPTMHQYFGHTAYPPPLPTGNMFIPPPTAAPGMKYSPAHYKPGTNTGNHVPAGMPSGYGVYSSTQVGYNPNAAVTSGNSSSSEDLVPPVLKDNVYPGQQSDGSAIWFPAAGRDAASFPVNSFLNLPPQGQHVLSPQSGHGPFAVYHTLQPMPTPAPGLPLLQQSQPVAGPVESVGPPSNAYHQSQRQQQMNWNL